MCGASIARVLEGFDVPAAAFGPDMRLMHANGPARAELAGLMRALAEGERRSGGHSRGAELLTGQSHIDWMADPERLPAEVEADLSGRVVRLLVTGLYDHRDAYVATLVTWSRDNGAEAGTLRVATSR